MNITTFLHRSFILMAAVATCRAAAPLAAEIAVSEKEVLRPYTRDIYGLNFDWYSTEMLLLGREDGPEKPDVAEALEGLRFPFNRVSGTDSQAMRWKDAIGPVSERKPIKLWGWSPEEKVAWGPVEFFRWVLARDAQAKFLWVTNLYENEQEHADLVEFLTGKAGQPWADKRISLGLKDPLPIAVWEIGNEMDWAEQKWPIERYLEAAGKAISAIRKADPKAKIAMHSSTGFDPGWEEWHRAVLKKFGSEIDYLAYHAYYRTDRPLRDDQIGGAGASFNHENWLAKIKADIRELTGSDRIKIMITEHGHWPVQPKEEPWGSEWEKTWYSTHSLEGCLASAQMIATSLNDPEIVGANYHSFSSGPWGLIYRDKQSGKVYTTGMAELYRLLFAVKGDEVVRTRVTGQDTAIVDGPSALTVVTVKSPQGLNMIIVNRGEARQASFSFEVGYRVAEAKVLTASDLDAYNRADDQPLVVRPAEGFGGAPFRQAAVPANSVTLLTLEKINP